MDNINIIPLFASPIAINKISPINKQTKEFLFSLEYKRMKTDNGWVTDSKRILDLPECETIKQSILEVVNIYARSIIDIKDDIDFYITNSWIIKHNPGDWSQTHIHTNSIFSGILYLECVENSGDLSFEKPLNLNNCIPLTIDLPVKNYNIFNSKLWTIKPEDNMLILFPSSLPHCVSKNSTNNYRYSLAFNIFAKGTFGSEEDLCYLQL